SSVGSCTQPAPSGKTIRIALPERAAVGERRLLTRDELEERGSAALRGLPGAGEGARDVLGPLYALGPSAHRTPEVGVTPADVARAVLVVRDDEVGDLDGHARVVEHDGEDRDAAADGGLEVEPGHTEGGVAHEVHAELVGRGELGADGQPEPGPEGVRLAPAEIAARRHGAVERQELVARAAGGGGDDGVGTVDGAHEPRA